MEPLAVIASVVGIADAVAKCLNGLEKILGARAEFHALINETSDLQVVLGSVQTIVYDSENHDAIHRVSIILNRLKIQLLELNQLINYRLKRLGGHDKTSQIKVDRLQWFQKSSTVKRLQQDLRDSRQNLAIVLACSSAAKQSRIEMKLQSIYVQMTESNRDLSQFQARTVQSLAQKNLVVRSFSELFSQKMFPILAHSADKEIVGRLTKVFKNDGDSIRSEVRGFERESITKSSLASIRISASLQHSNECQAWCNCACHIRRKLSTPPFLKKFIGQLFIGYTGIPLMEQHCDQFSCQQKRGSTNIQVSYCFPSWFFAKMLSLSLKSAPLDGPQINLTIPRIVDEKAAIFSYARIGDVEGIKSLFETRIASPRDTSWIGGYTALHVAIYRNQIEVCQFLLSQNADPLLETFYEITPTDIAWDMALVNHPNHKSLLELFSETQFLKRRQFSFLHLIVLGLTKIPRNLRLELEQSTSLINAKDFHGRTALHWAAARGDSHAVDTLLAFGANPEIADSLGSTALHYAAWIRTQCLELLLTSGANPNCKNKFGDTPLHWAAAAATDATKTQSIEILLQYGAEVNAMNEYKATPLFYACEFTAPEYADPITSSAVKAPDDEGNKTVTDTLDDCASNTVRALLSHGASYRVKTSFNETILHTIASARHVDISSIRRLTDLDWRGVDVNTRNSAGYTARERLPKRFVSPDVSIAYEALFRKVEVDNREEPRVHEVTEHENFSVFEDAIEYQ